MRGRTVLRTRLTQVGVLLLALMAAVGMVRLGWWQLDVYRQQADGFAVQRADEPARPLTDVAPAGTLPEDGYGRTVTFAGEFESTDQFLVPVPERPGHFRVLTALVQADGSRVPVVRGEAVLEGGTATPPAPPTGEQQLSGILLASEASATSADDATPVPGQIGSVRLAEVAQAWPAPLVNGFVSLDAPGASASGLAQAQVSLPRGEGQLRNGGYAVQWVVFAGFGLAMAVVVARDIGRRALLERVGEVAQEPSGDAGPD